MTEPRYIYAFKDERCIYYVGQTIYPEHRHFCHVRASASKLRTGLPPTAKFTVLRSTTDKDINRLERQIILNLKRKGQAQFNLKNGILSPRATPGRRSNGPIVWNRMRFESKAQLERYKARRWPIDNPNNEPFHRPMNRLREYMIELAKLPRKKTKNQTDK